MIFFFFRHQRLGLRVHRLGPQVDRGRRYVHAPRAAVRRRVPDRAPERRPRNHRNGGPDPRGRAVVPGGRGRGACVAEERAVRGQAAAAAGQRFRGRQRRRGGGGREDPQSVQLRLRPPMDLSPWLL